MVLFQLQPALNGVIFSEEVLLPLVSIPNVVAIKGRLFDAVQFSGDRPDAVEGSKIVQILTGTCSWSRLCSARRRSLVQDDRARGTARDYRQIQG